MPSERSPKDFLILPMLTFHTYSGNYYQGDYYLRYQGENTLRNIIKIITKSKPLPKLETPAIVMNKFKTQTREIQNGIQFMVKNAYDNLDHTTGWYALDVDGCGKLTNLVKQSLTQVQQLKIVWVSSSGQGIKAIGYNEELKNLTPQKYREAYKWLCYDVRQLAGMKINFDPAQGRCHQPVFLNSDKLAFVR